MPPISTFDRSRITAEITFLRTDEGGRKSAPDFSGYWFLHVVVQDRSIRQAKVMGNKIQELYHPLAIIEAPAVFQLGDTAKFVLAPMYYPNDRFPEFQPGVMFTAREGSRIIAHGVVLSREEPAVT